MPTKNLKWSFNFNSLKFIFNFNSRIRIFLPETLKEKKGHIKFNYKLVSERKYVYQFLIEIKNTK